MICDNCHQDRAQNHIKIVAFPRLGWPPIELVRMCRRCRMELTSGFFNRGLFFFCCLLFLAAVGACGFGLVRLVEYLIEWLHRDGSTL